MPTDLVTDIAAHMHVTLDSQENLKGSMSGSHVLPVTLSTGTFAVLKTTVHADDDASEAAQRELAFYRDLADRTPVRTPRLLDHRVTPEFTAMLLTAHRPSPPAPTWDDARWLALARDLAHLHTMQVPADPLWRRTSWLIQTLRAPDLDRIRKFWSLPGEPELLEPLLSETTALEEAVDEPAPRFLHGDCHTDNLLVDGADLVWADWQSAVVGSPAGDLAFPLNRATPSGATPPVADMVGKYARLRHLDADRLMRSVVAAQLAFLTLGFPLFAALDSGQGTQHAHDRFRALARAWLDLRI